MEPNTEKNPRLNPLVVPLIAVSALFVAAAGTAAYLLGSQGHPAAETPTAPAAAVKESAAAAPSKTAATPSRFDAVALHLDKGGTFYLYLDTAQWLEGLGKQIDSFRQIALTASASDPASRNSVNTGFTVINDLITNSGLEEISAVGASSISVEPKIYLNKFFIHHATEKANGFLWSAFGKAPHHLDIIDFLPVDTALATSSDLDLSNTLAGLRTEFSKSGVPNATQTFDMFAAQFATNFGMPLEDLLKTLDGPIGLILTLDQSKSISLPIDKDSPPTSFPTPRLAILLRVKDDRIFGLFDKALAGTPGLQRHDTPELRTRVLPIPGPTETWLVPTVAQWSEHYLVIASNESLIKDMLEAQKTGKGLKSMPQFASLRAGLPEEGNGVQIITPLLGDTLRVIQREAMKNQPTMTPDQAAMMEKFFGQSSGPMSICSISTHLPDGWLTASKGTASMNMMLGPGMIIPAAIAAGVALPVFGEVQEKGKATKSLTNAKQIVTACRLYAVDHQGKFPPTLDALVPDYLPEKTIFASPFLPGNPVGYTYSAGHSDSDPATTVIIEDKFAPEKHLRVVVRIDGSGEVIHLPKTAVP